MSNMDDIPQKHDFFDAIDVDEAGKLLLGVSNLTRRYWVGSMWYYKEPKEFIATENATHGVQFESGVCEVKFVQGTNSLVCGTDSGSVQLWNVLETGLHCLAEPVEHDHHITSISCNANKSQVISSSLDRRIKVWDLDEFVALRTYNAHWSCVNCVACHPSDSSVFLSCSKDGSTLLWDLRKPKPASKLGEYESHASPTWISWNPIDTNLLAVSMESGSVHLVDVRQPENSQQCVQPHNRSITRMAFSNSGLLATASEDCTSCIYNFEGRSASLLTRNKEHTDFVRSVCWMPDQPVVYSCSWDGTIRTTTCKNSGTETCSPEKQTSNMETSSDVS